MLRFFTVATFIGAFFAFFALVIALGSNNTAYTSAAAATAIALVGIPYCVTRTLWMLKQRDDAQATYKVLLQIRDNVQPTENN